MLDDVFTKILPIVMWKDMLESDRTQMTTWRMRTACCIPKATNILSEYIIIIVFQCMNSYVNAPQHYVLTMYIACLITSPNSQQNCLCYVASPLQT